MRDLAPDSQKGERLITPGFVDLMYQAAQATGCNFHLGARPHDKGWFAHSDGIEFDGSTPEQAVLSVITEIKRRMEAKVHEAASTATVAAQVIADLPDLPEYGDNKAGDQS